MSVNCKSSYNCPVEATIDLIGGKYKSVILWHLMGKTLRYSALHKLVPKATDKMLAQQLRELENDGLINRKSLSCRSSQNGIFFNRLRQYACPNLRRYVQLGNCIFR